MANDAGYLKRFYNWTHHIYTQHEPLVRAAGAMDLWFLRNCGAGGTRSCAIRDQLSVWTLTSVKVHPDGTGALKKRTPVDLPTLAAVMDYQDSR